MSSELPKLSLRLRTLFDLADRGGEFWDIGCDHGHVGLWATQRFSRVHWVDPSPPVQDQLKQTIAAHIPEGFSFSLRCEKGEELKVPRSQHVFFLAGMGGKTIRRVLAHLRSQAAPDSQYLVSPHTELLAFRAWLREEAWGFLEERAVEEGGQFYQLFSLEGRAGREVPRFGEGVWQGEVGSRHRERVLRDLAPHRNPADQELVAYLRCQGSGT